MASALPSASYYKPQEHEEKELIGEGTFAKVYKVTRYEPSKHVIARKVFEKKVDGKEKEMWEKEVVTLKSVGGQKHIVQYLNSGRNMKGKYYMDMEYCPGGNLDRHLQTYNPPRSTKMKFMEEITLAVQFLHGQGIAHRDLKPDNIMMYYPDGDATIKVGDFGLAKLTKPGHSTMNSACGTPNFAAPEIAKIPKPGQIVQYKKLADIFSMGVIYCAMLTMTVVKGRLCFPQAYEDLDINTLAPELHPETNKTLLHLLVRMLHKVPSERPTASYIRPTLKRC